MAEHYAEYDAYLAKLAESNITDGVLYEPRAYFDMLPLAADQREVFSNQEVFRNGEDFPVVITHMTASLSQFEQDGSTAQDERLIQQVGAYLKFHDQYYMNPPQAVDIVIGGVTTSILQSAPLPAWVNKNVATSDMISRGCSSWRFPRPFILSTRDSLRVEVMTPYPIVSGRRVTVSFTGIGTLSRQPYQINGTATLLGNNTVAIDTEQYLNDGAEPILMTDMSVVAQPDTGDVNNVSDTRGIFLRVRQIGNGTGADWFQGPLNVQVPGTGVQLPSSSLGAINAGVTSGRAIVHEFPRALVWEPGEGIEVAAQSISSGQVSTENSVVQISMSGYIAVQ
jgi:hypothetical protein